jgi:thioredoxin reductase/NAD-dependent dihydropyrimidine dehydrogenase PreA subunit
MHDASSPIIFSVLLAAGMALGLAAVLLLLWRRREDMRRSEAIHRERSEAIERGSHKARLIHPEIDLSQCIGCGACVRACPEEGVLDLLHGQAVVVHGARCVGHGRCAEACPAGAISLTFADLQNRSDLPAIDEEFQAVDVPGLYLAGELTGFSLVRNAVGHGTAVANAVARRVKSEGATRADGPVDLLIVGVGPAGLACALRAKELGLRFEVIEQAEELGGTVAAYPRKKLVMTQPMVLPLHGLLPRLEWVKEDLVALWTEVVQRHALPIRMGVRLKGVARGGDGVFTADTSAGEVRARAVCLCLGRRGTPRKLGVPGESLPKVLYSLLDAESYRDRHILVVGGGDSAAEAAMALAEQPGNTVTLSVRGRDLSRIKTKNQARLAKAVHENRLAMVLDSSVERIDDATVTVLENSDDGPKRHLLPNDDVFVCIGGDPPFDLLKRAGVSFDASRRPKPAALADNTTPLIWATGLLLLVALGMLAWASLHRSYYGTNSALRTLADDHAWLRPGGAFGLTLGLAAIALFAWNLAYLARRNAVLARVLPGSLRFWMGSHVFTGIASFLCVIVHAGFTYRSTLGGLAFVTLGIVLVAGMVGRYFYAGVPRAANGREMDLDELRARVAAIATEWDKSSRGLGATVRDRIETMVREERWRASFVARVAGIFSSQVRIRRALFDLRMDPKFAEIPEAEREELMALATRSMKLTLQIAHFEEIRAVLGTWRFFHRWVALLMLLLVVSHIGIALRYARLDWPLPGWILAPAAEALR